MKLPTWISHNPAVYVTVAVIVVSSLLDIGVAYGLNIPNEVKVQVGVIGNALLMLVGASVTRSLVAPMNKIQERLGMAAVHKLKSKNSIRDVPPNRSDA